MSPNRLYDERAVRFDVTRAVVVESVNSSNEAEAGYELCFRSLLHEGRGYVFPCGVGGQVDLNALSERARSNYFYARALVGRDFSVPTVKAGTRH